MKKRILIASLCFALVFSMLFVSCGKNEAKAEDESTDTVETVENVDLLGSLPEKDMGGRDFVIMSEWAQGHFPDSITGEPIDDVKYSRALYVEEKYNVNIVCVDVPKFYEALSQAHLSGMKEYDLVFPHPTAHMQSILTTGLLSNLNDTEYVNLDGEWYNQTQVENYEANGNLYLCVPDATIVDTGFNCLVYNRDLYGELGFTEDLYEVVNSGRWTMEEFKNILAQTKTDGSGNEANKMYGLAFWEASSSAFMFAMGQNVFKKNSQGEFKIALDSTKLVSIAEKFDAVLKSGDVVRSKSNTAGWPETEAWKTFANEKALFITHDIGVYHTLLRDIEFDVGFLPLPKFDENQSEYRTVCAAGFWAIPAAVKDLDEAGIIMEALAVYSHIYLKPEFYETVLFGRLSNVEKDYEMLDFIHRSKLYDLAMTLDTTDYVSTGILGSTVMKDGDPNGIAVYLKINRDKILNLADIANGIGVSKE